MSRDYYRGGADREEENGMGWGGLVPTKAEREEEKRIAKARADARDAARWRFIMEHQNEYEICPEVQRMWANCKTPCPTRAEWESAIDAAIFRTSLVKRAAK